MLARSRLFVSSLQTQKRRIVVARVAGQLFPLGGVGGTEKLLLARGFHPPGEACPLGFDL